MRDPSWLHWARRLQAVAQNGLAFAEDRFDRARYADVGRIAAEMLAAGTGAPPDEVVAVLDAQSGYATPKVDVRGVVFRDRELLLVREREDGGWTLPGGWADVTDTPSEAVTREVLEEAGYRTRATKLLACLDRTRHGHVPALPFRIYKLFFRCELLEHVGSDGLETSAVGWFARGAHPPLSAGRVTEAQLDLLFAHHDDSDRPTDFD